MPRKAKQAEENKDQAEAKDQNGSKEKKQKLTKEEKLAAKALKASKKQHKDLAVALELDNLQDTAHRLRIFAVKSTQAANSG